MTTSPSWDPLEHLVTVTVTDVTNREVVVKLADGRPGVIAAGEFEFGGAAVVGNDVEAVMLTRDDPRGRAVLSRSVALKVTTWRDVEAARAAKEPVHGVVSASTKGGFVVDVGVRSFLPSSLAYGDEEAERDLVGEEVEVLVVDLDRPHEKLVVSRRDLMRRRDRLRRREMLSSFREGQQLAGTVVKVADFGLLVDLGGVNGLVPRSELDWDPRRGPAAVARIGDEVEVVVLEVRSSKGRVRLSMKRRHEDPFTLVAVGDRVSGRVVRVVDYGAFIEIADGELVGLCHASELSDDRSARPEELVVPGDEVMVKVLSIDRRRRRVSLSVVQGMWG